ncbi:DNA-3-methyladenine glycosylase I [Phytoactinopolyspora halotolerans]|uniref:DNA-3-methyladenine glycosylase I n=1 Tax=Phytoactinopolyspora halotolerans TaxID=1981512 RepID=A0A6L9S4Y9_9ACTN|nr:DNA-3-methyladenine glycosylase I [Phytoactinopolyspora halotolerans]NEE00535.1 DNA-3-methyladenine glycosylase I [Phytoactinopolyspora halotolerans]
MSREAAHGPDGTPRCPWALGSADYIVYHDSEWGRPVHGDVALYERLTLEGFQSGLSWLTILRKRDGFRRAFAGFEPSVVAEYDESDVARLLDDTAIVRNRAKVNAAITNARALSRLREEEGDGALDRLIWSFAPDDDGRPAPRTLDDVPALTPESTALARALKRRGFVFVGPTTAYATMQAAGLVNDHLAGCAHR